MANDLERFLQQAAERLAEKVNQAQQPKQGARPQPPARAPAEPRQDVRQEPRRLTPTPATLQRPAPAQMEPNVVDAIVVETNRREQGPNPLSKLDTRPGLAQEISNADEEMAEHIRQELDHDIMNLKDASLALSGSSNEASHGRSKVSRRKHAVSPLIDMLRQPESLRAAFLASEIFRRKF